MTSRRRVAFLTSHPIQYHAPLFRALARRPDVDLTVLFGTDQGARAYRDAGFGATVQWDVPLLDGYPHVILPNLNRRGTSAGFLGLVNPAVIGALRRGRFDALIVHGWAHATNWLAFLTARALGLPLLLRGESNGLREPRGWRRPVKGLALRWLFGGTAAFLAIGSLNREFYRRHGVPANRIFTVPYAVDNDFFRRAADVLVPQRDALRRQEGIPAGATVFMFCGKLTPVKRPLDLLAAFERLAAADRAVLLYVGDGPLRGAIERRAAGRPQVRVTGFRNQTEMPRYYALADVLVLPSEFEPWGLVVNEALNFGLRVIASDQVGAAPDLVQGEDHGQVVPVGDVTALGRALHACLQCPDPRPRLHGKRVIDAWGIDAAVDGIVEALAASERPPIEARR
jgi:glycosyltransferase involved in cell wall biosynthesis